MSDLLKAMLRELQQGLQQGLTEAEVARQVEVRIREAYGGDTVYVARQPKRIRQLRVEELSTCTQVVTAERTGLSVRQVRRIKNGK
jgi:hypothetical protein